jgi:Zn finger protein HypA/HybF involved in hydrogenase expression
MAWKRKYRCKACGYEAEVYEGRGLFRQQITAMWCPDCKTIQNIVVGGIIADVAPSYRSEVGRLCLQCGSAHIRIWDKRTCPKSQGEMEDTGEPSPHTSAITSISTSAPLGKVFTATAERAG